jgi:branched-subunit amino acid ABC-type transport system permease component
MLPLLIAGLPVGAMYALAALGLVVVHRATRNIDLSLGAVATAAAFAYHRLSTDVSLPAPLAAAAALGVAAVIGLAGASAARLVGPSRPLAAAVASLALGGLVLAACGAAFGTDTEFAGTGSRPSTTSSSPPPGWAPTSTGPPPPCPTAPPGSGRSPGRSVSGQRCSSSTSPPPA